MTLEERKEEAKRRARASGIDPRLLPITLLGIDSALDIELTEDGFKVIPDNPATRRQN